MNEEDEVYQDVPGVDTGCGLQLARAGITSFVVLFAPTFALGAGFVTGFARLGVSFLVAGHTVKYCGASGDESA